MSGGDFAMSVCLHVCSGGQLVLSDLRWDRQLTNQKMQPHLSIGMLPFSVSLFLPLPQLVVSAM